MVADVGVIRVGSATSCVRSNKFLRFCHLVLAGTFISILKSPIIRISRPVVCAIEISSSNKSILSFRALGGLFTIHIKKGLACGSSISAYIVSNLETSYSGFGTCFTVSLMYTTSPPPVLLTVSALSFLINS